MAVSTRLGEKVAEVLGIPDTSAATHVRNLREAGLLTKTGRGVTGAHMTARDAAHLLIAASASFNIKDSAETVRAFADLTSKGKPVPATVPSARFAKMCEALSAVDALTTLIEIVGAGDFPQSLDVQVHLFGPLAKAEIAWVWQGARWFEAYAPATVPTKSNDLERRSSFSEYTIMQVGALVAGHLQ